MAEFPPSKRFSNIKIIEGPPSLLRGWTRNLRRSLLKRRMKQSKPTISVNPEIIIRSCCQLIQYWARRSLIGLNLVANCLGEFWRQWREGGIVSSTISGGWWTSKLGRGIWRLIESNLGRGRSFNDWGMREGGNRKPLIWEEDGDCGEKRERERCLWITMCCWGWGGVSVAMAMWDGRREVFPNMGFGFMWEGERMEVASSLLFSSIGVGFFFNPSTLSLTATTTTSFFVQRSNNG